MVNLFFIRTFISVAQTGSFRVSAEKNHITQPAVSQHIRALEQKLNCVLFERTSKKIQLTPAGEIFFNYALQILELYDKAKSAISDHHTTYSGEIRIASIYTMGLYMLKPIMQHLLKKYPNIVVHVEYVHHEEIYELVKNGKADFGLVAFPKKSTGCDSKIFTHENLVVVQSSKNKLLKKKNLKLKDLSGVKFVGLGTTPSGIAIAHYLASKDVDVNIVKEDNNIEIVKNAVDVGMGISVLPKTTIQQELKNKTFQILDVTDFKLQRPLAIVHSKKKVFSKSARLFYDMVNSRIN